MRTWLELAKLSALRGGNVLKYYFGKLKEGDVKFKGPNDVVSVADLESEKVIKETIWKAFPNHEIVAEETGRVGRSEFVWYIDPLDGTKNFVRGLDVFGVCVALEVEGKLSLGVFYSPVREEMYWALVGEGAYKNNRRIYASSRRTLKGAFLATGFPHRNREIVDEYMEMFRKFSEYVIGIRRMGSACYDLCMVAEGIFDGFWEYKLKPWDIASGVVILKEAGGYVSDFEGEKNYLESGNVLGAGTKELLDEMLSIIKDVRSDKSKTLS